MKILCDVPVTKTGAIRAARDDDYRDWLMEKAAQKMTDLAAEKGRKLAGPPRFLETRELRLVGEGGLCIVLRFEADTIPM